MFGLTYSFRVFCEFQNLFIVDEVSTIIKQAIEEAIGGNAYQQNKVNMWTTQVVETCLQALAKLNKPFKYIGKLFILFLRFNYICKAFKNKYLNLSAPRQNYSDLSKTCFLLSSLTANVPNFCHFSWLFLLNASILENITVRLL